MKASARNTAAPRLLYYEAYDDIRVAINREAQLKGWKREKKLALIRAANPDFKDLAEQLDWQRITRHERMTPNNPLTPPDTTTL